MENINDIVEKWRVYGVTVGMTDPQREEVAALAMENLGNHCIQEDKRDNNWPIAVVGFCAIRQVAEGTKAEVTASQIYNEVINKIDKTNEEWEQMLNELKDALDDADNNENVNYSKEELNAILTSNISNEIIENLNFKNQK